MQDKDTTKSTFDQLFKPVNRKIFSQQLAGLEVDKYVERGLKDDKVQLSISQLLLLLPHD